MSVLLGLPFEANAQNGEITQTEHEWHKNHTAFFVGGMSPVTESKETSLALGIAYERRFTQVFGLETLADLTFGTHERTALFAAGITYRPFGGLKLMTGPGFEIEEPNDGSHPAHVNFVYGVGTSWEFHFGPLSLAPTIYVDFLGDTKTNVTFGVGIGHGY